MTDLTITDIKERIRRLESWHYGRSGRVETPDEFSGLPEAAEDGSGDVVFTDEEGTEYTLTGGGGGGTGWTVEADVSTTIDGEAVDLTATGIGDYDTYRVTAACRLDGFAYVGQQLNGITTGYSYLYASVHGTDTGTGTGDLYTMGFDTPGWAAITVGQWTPYSSIVPDTNADETLYWAESDASRSYESTLAGSLDQDVGTIDSVRLRNDDQTSTLNGDARLIVQGANIDHW